MSSSSKRLMKDHSSHSGSLKKRSSRNKSSVTSVDPPDLIANSILQDILETALDQIHATYMENQILKFVIHCAQQALERVLRIHFYQHNSYSRVPKLWSPQMRPDPSSPDSWAFNQIPQVKNMTTEQEPNTFSLIKHDMETKGVEMTVDPRVDLVSLPSQTLIEDVKVLIDELVENLVVEEEQEVTDVESLCSTFTMVVEGLQHYSDFQMGPQLSKLSLLEPAHCKLPKLDLPEVSNIRKSPEFSEEACMVERLPPIRTEASYKCRSMSLFEPAKKSKEKK